MSRRISKGFLALALTVAASLATIQPAKAGLIVFTLTGSGGTGSFDGTPFSGQDFVITALADTVTLATRSFEGVDSQSVQLTSLVYQIGANAAATAVTPSDFYAAMTEGMFPGSVSFANLTYDAANVFSADASAWDVISSFGPISSTYLGSGDFLTDQGLVEINGWSSATFTATASSVPEPASFGLIGIGGFALTLIARRRRTANGR